MCGFADGCKTTHPLKICAAGNHSADTSCQAVVNYKIRSLKMVGVGLIKRLHRGGDFNC